MAKNIWRRQPSRRVASSDLLKKNQGVSQLVADDFFEATGVSPTNYALTCAVGAYAISGQSATLTYTPGKVDYTLSCAAGSYAIAGQAATLKRSRTLSLATGAYTLSGVAATLKRGYSLSLAVGAYSIAGQAATFKRTYSLVCDPGAYSVAGQTATLNVGRLLALDAGAYALAGGDAVLDYVPGIATVNYTLSCDAGAYEISGGELAFDIARPNPRKNYWGHWGVWRPRIKDKEIEQEVAEVIEAKAIEVLSQPATVAEKRAQVAEMRQTLEDMGFAYKQAYKQIYLELIAEMRQHEEDEQFVAIMAALL